MKVSPQLRKGNYNSPRQERGAVLIVGLILLAVMMLGALSMMQGAVQDERLAGNKRASVTAFMAAEAGEKAAFEWLKDNWGDFNCTAKAMADPDGSPALENIMDDDFESFSYDGATYDVYVRQCNPEVKLLSIGRVGNVASEATLEFSVSYLDTGSGSRGGGLGGAINLVGDVDVWDTPNSNAFEVDGNGGSAVTTSSDDITKKVLEDVDGVNRTQNYHSGYDENGNKGKGGQIHTADFPEPWGSPNAMQKFVDAIKAGEADGKYYVGDDSLSIAGNNTVTNGKGKGNGNGNGNGNGGSNKFDLGSASDMRVTVIDGNANLDMKGNASGGGLLIVTGDLTFSGTPSWDGLIVVLGGKFEINGGGNGGIDGSIYLANMDTSSTEWSFNEEGSLFLTAGGGNASYRHNCDKLTDVHSLLKGVTPEAAAMWDMDNCNSGGNPAPGSNPGERNDDIKISAWRELINP